jgi:hypothetical protein
VTLGVEAAELAVGIEMFTVLLGVGANNKANPINIAQTTNIIIIFFRLSCRVDTSSAWFNPICRFCLSAAL